MPSQFTGRYFETFRDLDEPNRITEKDLVALSMLSVEVPAAVAVWILGSGADAITPLLEQVPADADFWRDDHLLAREGPMWQLWNHLSVGRWPNDVRGNGMGRTTISKLLAAKRPALVPVWDSVVQGVLGDPGADYWSTFRAAFPADLASAWDAATTAAAERATVLRRVDAAVWTYGRYVAPPRT